MGDLPIGREAGRDRCDLCGSADLEERFAATAGGPRPVSRGQAFRCTHGGYGVHGRIVRCRGCGLMWVSPRPAPAEIATRYVEVEDPLYEAEREGRALTFERRLRSLERLVGPADGRRLLDVGAYTGVFVEAARARGWDAVGLEPSRWATATARDRGLPVTQGFLEEGPYPAGSFDLVTLWDVIEHVTAPVATLRLCHEALRPGGTLAVHTMDAGSPAARLLGRRWPWLMEMHLFYFDRSTLRAMLRAAGFEPFDCRAQGRYLRLSYLATRLGAFWPRGGRLLARSLAATGLGRLPVPLNFGDLFTVCARARPASGGPAADSAEA